LRFSESWQLVINTGTTIVTFLMVFLIQNTQNRDSVALQTKLDELIRTSQAENELIGIEKHRPRVGGAACQMRGGSPAGAGGAAPGADGEGVAPRGEGAPVPYFRYRSRYILNHDISRSISAV